MRSCRQLGRRMCVGLVPWSALAITCGAARAQEADGLTAEVWRTPTAVLARPGVWTARLEGGFEVNLPRDSETQLPGTVRTSLEAVVAPRVAFRMTLAIYPLTSEVETLLGEELGLRVALRAQER